MAYTFIDYCGEEIHLSDEVYQVVLTKHPEAKHFFDRINETLTEPDQVRKSVSDVRVRLYYRFYSDVLDGKFIVTVVKQADKYFISTFYATDKIKEGEIIWRK